MEQLYSYALLQNVLDFHDKKISYMFWKLNLVV